MKRFTLAGRIVKVDDEHAYLLRTGNWILQDSVAGFKYACIRPKGGTTKHLSHLVLGITDSHKYVYHLNGDSLDCCRENLSLTPSPLRTHKIQCALAARRIHRYLEATSANRLSQTA